MYHSISGPGHRSDDPRAVPAGELEEQVARLLADGCAVVGLTEALALLDASTAWPVVALTFDDGLVDLLNGVEVLKRLGGRATAYIPTGTVGSRSSDARHGGPRLSWSELVEVSRSGFELGSHSVSHRPLDVLPSGAATRELVDSRKLMEDRLGLPVESFCYPHGYASHRVRRQVLQAGYTNACVVGRRIAGPRDDRVALPRLEVLPGLTSSSFCDLLRHGEPGLAPRAKRVAMPAWRVARTAAYRWSGRQLT
jgi:peptidoglycan/xylan/chitin deacetylase (PgdA/CDA1 family)